MIKIIRILAVLLLLFNGIGALYGGWVLMTDPTGVQMQLPAAYLEHIPFKNYFVPGLILFTANGLFSFAVLAALAFQYRLSSLLIMGQGIILCGWIVIQMLMVQDIYYLHVVMGSAGLGLVGVGFTLFSTETQREFHTSK
ncbi:MAG: hypothetical protein U0X91_32710 [Spirosomataceae bacterium]